MSPVPFSVTAVVPSLAEYFATSILEPSVSALLAAAFFAASAAAVVIFASPASVRLSRAVEAFPAKEASVGISLIAWYTVSPVTMPVFPASTLPVELTPNLIPVTVPLVLVTELIFILSPATKFISLLLEVILKARLPFTSYQKPVVLMEFRAVFALVVVSVSLFWIADTVSLLDAIFKLILLMESSMSLKRL